MQYFHTIAPLAASISAGCSAWLAATILSRIVQSRRHPRETFEQTRREELRKSNRLYRVFEPLIDELVKFFPESQSRQKLAHHLRLVNHASPWLPAEFLATKTVEAGLVSLVIFCFIALLGMPLIGLLFAAATGFMYLPLARGSIINRGKARLKAIKLRLPFAIDQISLMMEAGAGFEDGLRTVVSDNPHHPLSTELSEVIRQMALGRPRSQALTGFRDRMADEDVSEIVFAIIKGEELGTPLSRILRDQANQMRLKRSQWGEKAASEAEVQMVFPGMITMVACLLVIIAPILLPVVVQLFAE